MCPNSRSKDHCSMRASGHAITAETPSQYSICQFLTLPLCDAVYLGRRSCMLDLGDHLQYTNAGTGRLWSPWRYLGWRFRPSRGLSRAGRRSDCFKNPFRWATSRSYCVLSQDLRLELYPTIATELSAMPLPCLLYSKEVIVWLVLLSLVHSQVDSSCDFFYPRVWTFSIHSPNKCSVSKVA